MMHYFDGYTFDHQSTQFRFLRVRQHAPVLLVGKGSYKVSKTFVLDGILYSYLDLLKTHNLQNIYSKTPILEYFYFENSI